MPFGGMLGSTFNFVFEVQIEKLQDGDRFYYLQRLDGLHLFGEMENNSFAALIMRNTDATTCLQTCSRRRASSSRLISTKQFIDVRTAIGKSPDDDERDTNRRRHRPPDAARRS